MRPDDPDSGLQAYFARCRSRVPGFVERHYRYPGALRTNRLALGGDLLRAPLNLCWAPFYCLAVLARHVANRAGMQNAADFFARVPAGIPTRVQRYLFARIEREILGLDQRADASTLRSLSRESLARYGGTRTASADIANSLASTVFGAVALKQFTPGGIAIGLLAGSWFASRSAIAGFPLGESLGAIYYSWFPPTPSFAQQAVGVLLALVTLAVIATLSGLVTDPLQARLGLHERRLHRMLDRLETDLHTRGSSSYEPGDPYLARLLDLVDAVRSQLP